MKMPPPVLLTLFAGAMTVFVVVHLAIWKDARLFSETGGSIDTLVSILTLFGGTWAVWLLFVRTKHSDESVRLAQRTFENSERAELAVRFAKAVELLESTSEAVRVGSVLLLRDVARGDPDAYLKTVQEILQAFIERSCRDDRLAYEAYLVPPQNDENGEVTQEELYHWEEASFPVVEATPSDVLKAVEVLGDSFHTVSSDPRHAFPIKGLVLMQADFTGLALRNIFFRDCYFVASTFETSDLSGCTFDGAWMGEISFTDCSLERVTVVKTRQGHRTPYSKITAWNSDASSATLTASHMSLNRCDLSGLHAITGLWDEHGCWYRLDEPTVTRDGLDHQYAAFDATSEQPARRTERGMRMYDAPVARSPVSTRA